MNFRGVLLKGLRRNDFRNRLSGPVAGPSGNLFPYRFIYLVHVFGQSEPLAAIHAAKTHRASTKQQLYRPAALPAFQSGIYHLRILYPISVLFETDAEP
jgi:hypothetical protein